MAKFRSLGLILFLFWLSSQQASAQVNTVTFGKNRLQFKRLNWQYYQTTNFNVYFNAGGQELAKFALQVAELELTDIETAAEYSLQRRANIILYNSYNDYQQSNIGLDNDIITLGNTTKLVNNKMLVYFEADHGKLRRQIRRGIAGDLRWFRPWLVDQGVLEAETYRWKPGP